MNDSLKKMKVGFADVRQERSHLTLQNLLQAAEALVENGDANQFDARTLSKISGYSLGGLIKRIGKIENIFLYVIALGRSKHLKEIADELLAMDPDASPRQFVERLTDLSFAKIQKVNPSVIRYFEKRAVIRAENLATVYSYTEEILAPLLALNTVNQTGAFRRLDEDEARYICRAFFLFIERPFVEGDPMAGTTHHKTIVVENIVRLLSA